MNIEKYGSIDTYGNSSEGWSVEEDPLGIEQETLNIYSNFFDNIQSIGSSLPDVFLVDGAPYKLDEENGYIKSGPWISIVPVPNGLSRVPPTSTSTNKYFEASTHRVVVSLPLGTLDVFIIDKILLRANGDMIYKLSTRDNHTVFEIQVFSNREVFMVGGISLNEFFRYGWSMSESYVTYSHDAFLLAWHEIGVRVGAILTETLDGHPSGDHRSAIADKMTALSTTGIQSILIEGDVDRYNIIPVDKIPVFTRVSGYYNGIPVWKRFGRYYLSDSLWRAILQ